MTARPLAFVLAAAAAAAVLTAPAARAESIASSASSATSASLGSLSDSLAGSSNSSATTVADGDWRILEIAQRDDRPGTVRVRLLPLTAAQGGEELLLTLPRETAEAAELRIGQTVRSSTRPWGWRFARADRDEPFFLVLADERHRTLAPQPLL